MDPNHFEVVDDSKGLKGSQEPPTGMGPALHWRSSIILPIYWYSNLGLAASSS